FPGLPQITFAVQQLPGGGISGGGGGVGGREGEGEDEGDDVLNGVPYPWWKPYTHASNPLTLLDHRTRPPQPPSSSSSYEQILSTSLSTFFTNLLATVPPTSSSTPPPLLIFHKNLQLLLHTALLPSQTLLQTFSHALNMARKEYGGDIIFVAPWTKTYDHLKKSEQRGGGGLAEIFAGMRGGEGEDDESGGGGVGLDVEDEGGHVPPSGAGGAGGGGGVGLVLGGPAKSKSVKFETGLESLLGVLSVGVVPPFGGDVTLWRELVERDWRAIVRSENLGDLRIFGRDLGCDVDLRAVEGGILGKGTVFEERFLRGQEVERVWVLAIGEARKRRGDGTVETDDIVKAIHTFSDNAHSVTAIRNGLDSAHLPPQIHTLTKHERKILKQCLISPSTLPSSPSSSPHNQTPPSDPYSSIGGLSHIKRIIDETIRLPLLYPHIFAKGILKGGTKGLLMFGPPGTGKTLLARSVAAGVGARFLDVRMSSVGSMWVGESEKVRE
ncbi:hypothetical protein HK097_005672, partial [Rhizophlyctis rosea]